MSRTRLVPTLTIAEYHAALTAAHGTVRRYLAGCRCDRCDTHGNRRFKLSLPREWR